MADGVSYPTDDHISETEEPSEESEETSEETTSEEEAPKEDVPGA